VHSLEDWLTDSFALSKFPIEVEWEMAHRAPAWYTRLKASGALKTEIERLTTEA
jgi:hypothetical protein